QPNAIFFIHLPRPCKTSQSKNICDVNELKTPKIDELRLPDLFYRVTSDSAIALKTLTIQQHLSSKKPEKQITSCF
ncbi:hypothetical protein, partial [Klebsiella pneumoniae]